jgi:hypothetical protein
LERTARPIELGIRACVSITGPTVLGTVSERTLLVPLALQYLVSYKAYIGTASSTILSYKAHISTARPIALGIRAYVSITRPIVLGAYISTTGSTVLIRRTLVPLGL